MTDARLCAVLPEVTWGNIVFKWRRVKAELLASLEWKCDFVGVRFYFIIIILHEKYHSSHFHSVVMSDSVIHSYRFFYL